MAVFPVSMKGNPMRFTGEVSKPVQFYSHRPKIFVAVTYLKRDDLLEIRGGRENVLQNAIQVSDQMVGPNHIVGNQWK